MKKGYMSCPFCANEIKEGALKCQYCHEFLNKNTEENNNTREPGIVRYKNKWIWIVLGIIVLVIIIYFSNFGKQLRVNYLVNKVDNRIQNRKTEDDLRNDLNDYKNKSKKTEEKAAFEELGELMDDFLPKVKSIESDLYLEDSNYKNKTAINKAINARKLYDQYFKEYSDKSSALFQKYKSIDDTGNGKYSLSGLSKEIKKLSNCLHDYADKNIEFYNYLLTIQDDFYVDIDGQVYFYDGGTKMDKYNQLSTELYNATIKYLEDYNNYTKWMDEYDRYWGL